MSRVLISFFAWGNVKPIFPLYASLIDSLRQNGNDVLALNVKNFDDGSGAFNQVPPKIVEEILQFRPDFVLSFNNALPVVLVKNLYCPICLVDADVPEIFFNKNYIKNNPSKFIFLGTQGISRELYENTFGISVSEKRYLYFPAATSIKAKSIIQDKSISFIGSNFGCFVDIRSLNNKKMVNELYTEIKKDYFINPMKLYSSFAGTISKDEFQTIFHVVRDYSVHIDRIKYLSEITDLGLNLFGMYWDVKSNFYDFDVINAFNDKKIQSIEDNEWVYNSSKIAINISHPQAKTSFAWRVMDIMASNACLVMEEKEDWHNLFGEYISDEVKEKIVYKDRFDMRKKCIELLENKSLRKKAVKECQYAISRNGKWENRFRNIETFLDIKLLNCSSENGVFRYIYEKRKRAECVKIVKEDIEIFSVESKKKHNSIDEKKRRCKKRRVKVKKIKKSIKINIKYLIEKFLCTVFMKKEPGRRRRSKLIGIHILLIIDQIPLINKLMPKKIKVKLNRLKIY